MSSATRQRLMGIVLAIVSGVAGYVHGQLAMSAEAQEKRGVAPLPAPLLAATPPATAETPATLSTNPAPSPIPLAPPEPLDARPTLFRSYLSKEHRARLARWEDPGGRLRASWFGLWPHDPTGGSLRRALDAQPNRQALYELLTEMNPADDWLNTADFIVATPNFDPATRSRLIDLTVDHWLHHESPTIVAQWLRAHAGDPHFDSARGTLALRLPVSEAPPWLANITDPAQRELFSKMIPVAPIAPPSLNR